MVDDVRNSTIFYVSVTGNDADEGTEQRPFATLQRAQIAVREYFIIWMRSKLIAKRIAHATIYYAIIIMTV